MTKEKWEYKQFGDEHRVIRKGSFERLGPGFTSCQPICEAETKELAKVIAISPELADVLEQSLPYLREAAKTDGHANGNYQLASKLLKKWNKS
ncbi:hypothetical protein EPNKCIFM_00208 [Klebsiella phage KP13-16]|nr:hypothetical protein EPNKCIFM_00208 [Klebsiella phage KP13-16]